MHSHRRNLPDGILGFSRHQRAVDRPVATGQRTGEAVYIKPVPLTRQRSARQGSSRRSPPEPLGGPIGHVSCQPLSTRFLLDRIIQLWNRGLTSGYALDPFKELPGFHSYHQGTVVLEVLAEAQLCRHTFHGDLGEASEPVENGRRPTGQGLLGVSRQWDQP